VERHPPLGGPEFHPEAYERTVVKARGVADHDRRRIDSCEARKVLH
jgi:hypothetical protein